ncbi:unnamed protein product, partial [Gulo gulo]
MRDQHKWGIPVPSSCSPSFAPNSISATPCPPKRSHSRALSAESQGESGQGERERPQSWASSLFLRPSIKF